MAYLRKVGFKYQLTTIEHSSIAARCRIAATAASFERALEEIEAAKNDDDVLFAPPTDWWEKSILRELEQAHNIVYNIQSFNLEQTCIDHPHAVQRHITEALREQEAPNFFAFLSKRLC